MEEHERIKPGELGDVIATALLATIARGKPAIAATVEEELQYLVGATPEGSRLTAIKIALDMVRNLAKQSELLPPAPPGERRLP